MIPKIIHYCWFGRGEHPELVKKCIASWEKYLPEFEIIEWNEDNFDLNSNQFVKEAYEAKKYAFVSDYVRLYALYKHGGIYLDSDVEVIKPLTPFLKHAAFTGGESSDTCITGTMGAEKGHKWIENLLKYYEDKSFYSPKGKITNTIIITEITKKLYGFSTSTSYQNFENELHIYPFDYFCAKNLNTGFVNITENTYTIHHFNGSWLTQRQKIRYKRILFLKKILGTKLTNELIKYKKYFLK